MNADGHKQGRAAGAENDEATQPFGYFTLTRAPAAVSSTTRPSSPKSITNGIGHGPVRARFQHERQ